MFRLKEKLFLLLSSCFLMLFILSCSSSPPLSDDIDDAPQPDPITVYGSWVSGEVLYHPNVSTNPLDETLACESTGISLDEFTAMVIEQNISLEAYHMAELVCDDNQFETFGYNSEEECITDYQAQNEVTLEGSISDNDIIDYQNKISYSYNYDEMDLILEQNENQEPSTYIISFEGRGEG